MSTSVISVLGAGSWGTALAVHLARNKQEVRLWGRDRKAIESMQKNHVNEYYLPGITLPDNVKLYWNLEDVLTDVADILIAVPSNILVDCLRKISPYVHEKTRLIFATKGIDSETGLLIHELIPKVFMHDYPFAVLSG